MTYSAVQYSYHASSVLRRDSFSRDSPEEPRLQGYEFGSDSNNLARTPATLYHRLRCIIIGISCTSVYWSDCAVGNTPSLESDVGRRRYDLDSSGS
jgi:hypothetical protein